MNDQIPKALPAATIVLVRPAGADFEVYLLKRSTKSRYMGGLYVFPGGMLDESDDDYDQWSPHVDLNATGIEKRLGGGLSVPEASAYGIAAIRETFEEAGVLLASKERGGKDALARAAGQRGQSDHKQGWFKSLVKEENWCLELTRLFRWAHWVTPKAMKYRYDTRFYLAFMPPDQTCRPDARETTEGVWMRPIEGLEQNFTGKLGLSPPTLVTLHALSKFETHTALQKEISRRRWGVPIHPRMIPLAKGTILIEPWDPAYGQERIEINPDELHGKVLPVGTDFSRIWLQGGFWHPVGI